jgi:hypothetical protein
MTAISVRPRRLRARDAVAFGRLVAQDPIVNCVVAARLGVAADLDADRFGGQLWGIDNDSDSDGDHGAGGAGGAGGGRLRAAVFHGGNLIPIGDDPEAIAVLAAQLSGAPRQCSSIVGRYEAVERLWPMLRSSWGPARAIRAEQPLLVSDRMPDVAIDESVRRVLPSELDRILPACVAMFREELGVSPISRNSGNAYRMRVRELVEAGRIFARFDRFGAVEFKAEIGALSADTAQVQGVWVRPDLRGRGLGTAGMASVLMAALALAPTASLYVNDYNVVARSMYARLAMVQTAVLSTVLF